MKNLNILNKEVETMSSLEIAELTGKDHGHVMRDIREVFEQAELGEPKSGFIDRINNLGATVKGRYYELTRRECDLVISGYSVKYRMAIIGRWQELESQQTLLPDFNDPVASASAWADQVELVQERDLELSHAAPKVAVYKSLAERERDVKTTVLANRLEISPCQLEQFMVDQGIKLKYHDLPAAGYSDWFNLVERCDDDVEYIQALITPLGTIEITKLFNAHHELVEVNQ